MLSTDLDSLFLHGSVSFERPENLKLYADLNDPSQCYLASRLLQSAWCLYSGNMYDAWRLRCLTSSVPAVVEDATALLKLICFDDTDDSPEFISANNNRFEILALIDALAEDFVAVSHQAEAETSSCDAANSQLPHIQGIALSIAGELKLGLEALRDIY